MDNISISIRYMNASSAKRYAYNFSSKVVSPIYFYKVRNSDNTVEMIIPNMDFESLPHSHYGVVQHFY